MAFFPKLATRQSFLTASSVARRNVFARSTQISGRTLRQPVRTNFVSKRAFSNTAYGVNQVESFSSSKKILGAVGLTTGAVLSYYYLNDNQNSYFASEKNYDAVRAEIAEVLDDIDWDDGSWGPVFVRLAWHASGTYSAFDKTGGSDGAKMRFCPESRHGANAGLEHARAKLEPIKAKFPWISYADLWVLASIVAIEEMGGPKITFRPGRSDATNGKECTPDGRLPDAARDQDHIRAIFYRMGFNDREIVALVGAHVLGRCHTDRSGFKGPWVNSPTTFSNEYFQQLVNNTWTVKKWNGPKQYEDPTGNLMMLPTDMALLDDPDFKKYVLLYANDEGAFFKDFAAAYQKLTELGVDFASSGSVNLYSFIP